MRRRCDGVSKFTYIGKMGDQLTQDVKNIERICVMRGLLHGWKTYADKNMKDYVKTIKDGVLF